LESLSGFDSDGSWMDISLAGQCVSLSITFFAPDTLAYYLLVVAIILRFSAKTPQYYSSKVDLHHVADQIPPELCHYFVTVSSERMKIRPHLVHNPLTGLDGLEVFASSFSIDSFKSIARV
jgi:hypothetical protein